MEKNGKVKNRVAGCRLHVTGSIIISFLKLLFAFLLSCLPAFLLSCFPAFLP